MDKDECRGVWVGVAAAEGEDRRQLGIEAQWPNGRADGREEAMRAPLASPDLVFPRIQRVEAPEMAAAPSSATCGSHSAPCAV